MTPSPAPLAFRTSGSRDVPVVLLHGFLSDGASDWPESGLVGDLLASGRGVISIDLPGHGESPDPGTGELAEVVDGIVQAVRAVTSGEVDIVGYSLGSRIAWALAEDGRLPLRRAVLGGLPPFDVFDGLDAAELRRVVLDGATTADPDVAEFAQIISWSDRRDALVTLVAGLQRDPFRPVSSPGLTEVLFVVGAEDTMVVGGEQLVALVPGSRLLTVPGDHADAVHSVEFARAAGDHLR